MNSVNGVDCNAYVHMRLGSVVRRPVGSRVSEVHPLNPKPHPEPKPQPEPEPSGLICRTARSAIDKLSGNAFCWSRCGLTPGYTPGFLESRTPGCGCIAAGRKRKKWKIN